MKKTKKNDPSYNNKQNNLKNYNKILRRNINAAKNNYSKQKLEECKNDMKNTWKFINKIISNKNTKRFSEYMLDQNGRKIYDKLVIANKFNEYFINSSKLIDTSTPNPNNVRVDDFLTRTITTVFKFGFINQSDLNKIVQDLKPKQSKGVDNVSSYILKKVYFSIWQPLLFLINYSLRSGKFPNALKIANTMPVYKKDD